MALPGKKVRGKRARARWRERGQPSHDLRERYRRSDLPDPGHLAVVEIDNPLGGEVGYVDRSGNLELSARLEPVRHADGTLAEGAPAWAPPASSRVTAIRNLRGDTIGRMHARHQVSETQFNAARRYQELVERSTGTLHSLNPDRPVIDYVPPTRDLPAFRLAAAKQLHALEAEVKDWYGAVGLGLVRSALTDGNSIEAVARAFGASSQHEIRGITYLFRRALDCLARFLGLASSMRPPPRPARLNGVGGIPDTADARMHASAGELDDPALRRGKPNGRGQ